MARHDVSSPARATPASLFPNDFSSKNTVEKRVQADAIEAAKRKKADEEAAELARLRTAYPRLEAQTKALESERAPKDIELAVLRRQVGEMEHQLVQFRQDYDIMRTRLKQRDLDPSYAGKRIQIRLACWPHSAIELRDNPDGRAYGGECDPSARSQALRLKRVNVIDPNSAWTISLYDGSLDDGNFHLGLHPTSAPEVESQLGRNLDGPYKGNLQEWIFSINSQMTGYTIENSRFGFLEMEAPRENKNKKALFHKAKNETSEGQIWHIVYLPDDREREFAELKRLMML